MSGLLLKDIYCLMKQLKIFLVIVIVFSLIPGYSVSAFAVIYSALLPLSALSYDENSHWNSLAAMMPYTVRDLVLSKYVLGWLCMLAAMLLTALLPRLLSLLGLGTESVAPSALLSMACLALLIQGLCLPFMFKLGVEKGRLVFFALIIAACGAAFAVEKSGSQLSAFFDSSPIALLLPALAVSAASPAISVGIYRRKQA